MYGRRKMSTVKLFMVTLIVGIIILICSKDSEGMSKVILIIIGIILCMFALFGLITAFL